MTVYAAFAFLVGMYGAFGLGIVGLMKNGMRRKNIFPAVMLFLIVAVPTIFQFTLAPQLYPLFRRDYVEIIYHLQLWRLATATTVQDGGLYGAVFNLISLALLAPIAFTLLGTRKALFSAVAGALGGEFIGLLWQPLGAGNSVVCCGLASGILVHSFIHGNIRTRIVSSLVALIALTLLFLKDIHGAAFITALVTMMAIYLQKTRN